MGLEGVFSGSSGFSEYNVTIVKVCSRKKEHSIREAIEQLADEFNLSEEDRQKLLPSSTQAVFDLGWVALKPILKRLAF